MRGSKWRYLRMIVSFCGWFLLVEVAYKAVGNLSRLFFAPYFETAKAAFYEDLLDRLQIGVPDGADVV